MNKNDRSANVATVLICFQIGALLPLGIGIELVRIQIVVAEVVEQQAMELVGARPDRHGDVQAGILAFFRGRV